MIYDEVEREALHDYYDEDRRADARREDFDDAHPTDMRCEQCGAQWWGNWTRATRIDPPYPRNDCCPECGA